MSHFLPLQLFVVPAVRCRVWGDQEAKAGVQGDARSGWRHLEAALFQGRGFT